MHEKMESMRQNKWLRDLPQEELEERAAIALSNNPFIPELLCRKHEEMACRYDKAPTFERVCEIQGARRILSYLLGLPETVAEREAAKSEEESLDSRQ